MQLQVSDQFLISFWSWSDWLDHVYDHYEHDHMCQSLTGTLLGPNWRLIRDFGLAWRLISIRDWESCDVLVLTLIGPSALIDEESRLIMIITDQPWRQPQLQYTTVCGRSCWAQHPDWYPWSYYDSLEMTSTVLVPRGLWCPHSRLQSMSCILVKIIWSW